MTTKTGLPEAAKGSGEYMLLFHYIAFLNDFVVVMEKKNRFKLWAPLKTHILRK